MEASENTVVQFNTTKPGMGIQYNGIHDWGGACFGTEETKRSAAYSQGEVAPQDSPNIGASQQI